MEEKNYKFRIYIVLLLVVISIVLLILRFKTNKTEESKFQDRTEKLTQKQYTTDELKKLIPTELDTIMFQFGIKSEWVKDVSDKPLTEKEKKDTKKKEEKKKDKKDKKSIEKPIQTGDVLWFNKEVTIPKDLSLAELNQEIKSFLSTINFSCISNEDPKNFNQIMQIFNLADSAKKTLAKMTFVYSDKIRRESADVCIIIDNLDNLTNSQLEKLLSSSERFSIMLPDNIDRPDLQSIVLESKKDYLIKADIGTQEDITAEFRTDMKEKEWKSKVRSICYEFDKVAGVLLVNPKLQFRLETDVMAEFQKYPTKAYKDTILFKFASKETGKRKIFDLFTNILMRAKNGNRSQIYLVTFTEEDFQNYTSEVHNLKKRGYKFYNFSDIIKKRLKQEVPNG